MIKTVVAHQTLERALWEGNVDSYRMVKKYVQRLRRRLGDDAREPAWIASVHGVDDRFIGPPPSTQERLTPVDRQSNPVRQYSTSSFRYSRLLP